MSEKDGAVDTEKGRRVGTTLRQATRICTRSF